MDLARRNINLQLMLDQVAFVPMTKEMLHAVPMVHFLEFDVHLITVHVHESVVVKEDQVDVVVDS